MVDPFWIVLFGFIIAFSLSFGIGANDVANSFGTSVGSKVLTLKQACILATIFELLGSILIGANVSGTIRKGILDPLVFQDNPLELMLGYVSALLGCCIWLIIATILSLPVSGTHSIVGATVGMAIVSKGMNVIKWAEIVKIVASWVISPILSGLVSLGLFVLIRRFVLRAASPLEAGLRYLPLIYTLTICVNLGGILEASPRLLGIDKIPGLGKIALLVFLGALVYLSVWLVMVPYLQKKVKRTTHLTSNNNHSSSLAMAIGGDVSESERLYQRDHTEQQQQQIMITNNEKAAAQKKNTKSMAIQVDYVSLIVARNNHPNQSIHVNNTYQTQTSREYNNNNNNHNNTYIMDDSSADAMMPTIIGGSRTRHSSVSQDAADLNSNSNNTNNNNNNNNNNEQAAKQRQQRKRLISAPSMLKENLYLNHNTSVEDVNLTLRGYLTTVAPIRNSLSVRSGSQMQQKSVSNGSHDGGDGGGEETLKRLFVDPNSPPQQNNNSNNNNNNNNNEVSSVSSESQAVTALHQFQQNQLKQQEQQQNEIRRGRFNLVPTNQADALRHSGFGNQPTNGSYLELDAEVDENISEFPQKLDKKSKKNFDEEVDEFANADPPEAAKLFSFLQVMTAVFGSFAHGGNDVSNAIGPLIGLYLIYQEGRVIDKAQTPEWILFYGGVGISVGLWILGRRVIKTIGEDLTKITASSGFVIELASAMTVLAASLIKIPVSTTHCKVGSVVMTGRVRSKQSVDWSLFRNIIAAWIVTVPVTGTIAAGCQFVLKSIFIGPNSIS